MDSDGYSSDSSNSLIVDNSDLIDRRVSSSSSTNGTKSSAKEFRGVRVLLVDYDTVALHVILKMLKMFDYEAIGITGGLHGLKLLREKPYYFDLVVAAVHMPGMSGLELLQGIKLEFTTLPVILVSNDTDPEMAAKGISNGAAYFLHKPVSHCDVENMWKHVHKSKADETVNKNRYKEQTGSIVGQDSLRRKEKHRRVSGGDDEGNSQVESRKRKKGFVKDQPSDDKRNKKGRVVWTAQLHTDFLNAIENLGVDSAVPKKILEYMKVPGLTRENVASHLQKYRLFVKGIVVQNQNMEPKSFASRAFLSNFASDMSPLNMQQTDAPQQSFTPCRSGIRTGDFQGLNIDHTRLSHRGASTLLNTSSSGGYNNALFQFGQSSMLTIDNHQELIAASARHPWPTGNSNQNVVRVSPSQSHSTVSIGGGRSGKGTMEMVHRQNIVRWRSNAQTTAGLPLNSGNHSMIDRFNFQRQNNTEMERNHGTTRNVSVGSFAQALTPNTNNFIGIRILNNKNNSPETLHIGPVASNLINKPPSISSVMEVYNQMTEFPNMSSSVSETEVVPNLVPEFPGVPSSVPDIEVWNLNHKHYLTYQSATVESEQVSIPKTSAQNEATFSGGILNGNPQQETADPTPVIPVPAALPALNATEVDQAVEDEGDPFEGLFELARSDSNFAANSLPPLLDGEDFTDFLENFEQSTTDQGGALFEGENHIDPNFDLSMYQVDANDDSIFQL